ncbi:hypothetical protein L6452_14742 [Arctium lappa]|uniref:Uncharacterized protein n=1 Tax=Arctium lappa TaxID=4217 RepID=A0ACB9CLT9_ARCLA|nr:hypothetical protein L6452_14742 [Arctium lappa]
MVRSQMLENAFLIDNAIKKFDTIVPIMPLIGSLAKSKFCNALGHPIGKLVTWVVSGNLVSVWVCDLGLLLHIQLLLQLRLLRIEGRIECVEDGVVAPNEFHGSTERGDAPENYFGAEDDDRDSLMLTQPENNDVMMAFDSLKCNPGESGDGSGSVDFVRVEDCFVPDEGVDDEGWDTF